jgi:hypothetical protein
VAGRAVRRDARAAAVAARDDPRRSAAASSRSSTRSTRRRRAGVHRVGQPVFSGDPGRRRRSRRRGGAREARAGRAARRRTGRERKTRAGTIRVPQRALWVPRGAKPVDATCGASQRLLVWEHPVNAVDAGGLRSTSASRTASTSSSSTSRRAWGNDDGGARLLGDPGARPHDADAGRALPVADRDPRPAARRVLVALYYNEAWLAPRRPGLGIGVVDALAKDYRYRACTARTAPATMSARTPRAPARLADGSAHEAADGDDVREVLKEGTHGCATCDGPGVHDVRRGPEEPGEAWGAEGRA